MANAKNNSVKYLDLISQSAKANEKEELAFRNDEAELQVQTSILETKKAISVAKRALNDSMKAVPYSLSDEVEKTVELKDLEEGLKIAQTIQKARF